MQERIFHRDDSLGSEVLQQRDLFVGEGPGLLAKYRDIAEQAVVLAERHTERAPRTAKINQRTPSRIAVAIESLRHQVGGLNSPPLALQKAVRHCPGSELRAMTL